MSRSLLIHAPAKLNLALSVGRPVTVPERGAMHPIASWMVTIDLFDDLLVRRLDNGSVSRYAILWHKDAKRRTDINWSITKDLAVRAHLALERHAGRALPVQLKLDKRIPVGGGLGGGSSDAAAMLRAVNQLFELGLSIDELAQIGATLGSDVPFLVHGGSAVVEGFGESISHHDAVPEIHAVVAFPEASCPTARVYAAFDQAPPAADSALKTAEINRLAARLPNRVAPESLFNDLTPAAIGVAERLEDDLAALGALAERPAHLSGSGSSIFVLCDDAVHAGALAEAVEGKLGLPAVAVRTWTFDENPPS